MEEFLGEEALFGRNAGQDDVDDGVGDVVHSSKTPPRAKRFSRVASTKGRDGGRERGGRWSEERAREDTTSQSRSK